MPKNLFSWVVFLSGKRTVKETSYAAQRQPGRGLPYQHLQREAFAFDLFELRAVHVEISDDVLVCLDWGQGALQKLAPDGEMRIKQVSDAWGVEWPRPR